MIRPLLLTASLVLMACALPPGGAAPDGPAPGTERRPAADQPPVFEDGNGPLLLRVITYNLKGLDWGNFSLPAYPEASSTADIVATLKAHAPDIVGLQESRRKHEGAGQSDEIAAALGQFHEFSVTTNSLPLPYDQQNAIVSRYRLLEQTDLDLGPDGAEHRRFLYARAALPGGRTLHLGNVHVSTRSALQLPAMQAIETFLRARIKEGDHFLITGDFNFGPSTSPGSPYLYVTEQLSPRLVDPAVSLGMAAADPQLCTISPADPRKRIDFIFASRTLVARAYRTIKSPIPNLTYPDHLAALFELEVPAR